MRIQWPSVHQWNRRSGSARVKRSDWGLFTSTFVRTSPISKGFVFFTETAQPKTPDPDAGGEPHFTLSLCKLTVDGPWPLQRLLAMQDKSYRAKRMSAGYYLTDHFAAPAYLRSIRGLLKGTGGEL
jgi:hypothetical protein